MSRFYAQPAKKRQFLTLSFCVVLRDEVLTRNRVSLGLAVYARGRAHFGGDDVLKIGQAPFRDAAEYGHEGKRLHD